MSKAGGGQRRFNTGMPGSDHDNFICIHKVLNFCTNAAVSGSGFSSTS